MRLLVCGGRDFGRPRGLASTLVSEVLLIASVLHREHAQLGIDVLIHGTATGVDSVAGQWANMHGIRVLHFSADWSKHGDRAGPIRNRLMLTEGKPDRVIAFPGGRGTMSMVGLARRAGIPVVEVKP